MTEKAKSMLKKIGNRLTDIDIDEYLNKFGRDKRSRNEENKKKQQRTAVGGPPPRRRTRSGAPQQQQQPDHQQRRLRRRRRRRQSSASSPAPVADDAAPSGKAVTAAAAPTAPRNPPTAGRAAKTLLVNGGCATYATAVNGHRVRVINTCAFDSLATILACAYADVPAYRAHVDGSDNAMLRYCRALAASGPVRGPAAAADRARVLWPALDVGSLRPPRAPGRPAVLDGECNVAHVATRLLAGEPSAVERVAPCPAAGCRGPAPPATRRSGRLADRGPPPPPRHLPSATVVLDWPAGGPGLLQAAVDAYADERADECGSCSRPSVSRRRVLSAHLLIEADSCEDAYGGPVRAALLPDELFRDGRRYVLYGIIHYGDRHYQSVIRKSNHWEIHNDLKNAISTTTKIGYLVPHLVVYIRT